MMLKRIAAFLMAPILMLVAAEPTFAQVAREVNFEAVRGTPFGVGRLVLPPGLAPADSLTTNNLAIYERDGRVLYPVFITGRFRKLLGELLGLEDAGGQALTVMFLFRGDEPLDITLQLPETRSLRLSIPPETPRARQRLMTQWWREYTTVAAQQLKESDYPPVVHAYLTSMLSRRLQQPLPPTLAPKSTASRRSPNSLEPAKESIQLLLGVEELRTDILRKAFSDSSEANAVADQPLPDDIQWGAPAEIAYDADVKIEPLAEHVPEDCFYIRFGRLANQTWLDKLTAEHGGEIANMVTLRGVKDGSGDRVQVQLALPPPANAIEEVVGDAMVQDVAFVGRDIYLEDGAAVGMLFQLRTRLFVTNLETHRQEVVELEQERGATLTTVRIADHDVSLLATPDHRLRSFMAVDGDYLLVTTSRSMVESFYEAGRGSRRLADLPEFKHARSEFPTAREDTIFAYFSSKFFEGLLSPRYQIEVERRLRSLADMQLIQLARQAAAAEGIDDAPRSLIAAGLAPSGFGKRPEGGGWEIVDDRPLDTLRGAPGTFLPIPDMELKGATRGEVAACQQRATFYETRWKRMDPLMVAIKRHLEEDDRERIVIDARVSPLDESKYGWFLSILGTPPDQRLEPGEDDMIFAQAYLKGGLLAPEIPPHQLFAGIKDAPSNPSGQLGEGILETYRALRTTPGYLGAWPKAGFLDLLPFDLGGSNPDANGFSKLPLGLWRRQWQDYSAVSFNPQFLAALPQQLQPTPVESPAQVRIQVKDLSQSQLQSWVNALNYDVARQSSIGNVKLLHALYQQLHVPPESAKEIAERMLNTTLVCPLGGEYEFVPGRNWQSTAWPRVGAASDAVPASYSSPLLKWFRGLDAQVFKDQDHLHLHAEVRLQRLPPPPAAAAPATVKPEEGKPLFNFNIFGGGAAKPAEKRVEKPAAKPAEKPVEKPAEPVKGRKQRDF